PRHHPPLPSFPTRRSSDLGVATSAPIITQAGPRVQESGHAKAVSWGRPTCRGIAAATSAGGNAETVTSPAFVCPFSHEVGRAAQDRKSTRLNSSHLVISYA